MQDLRTCVVTAQRLARGHYCDSFFYTKHLPPGPCAQGQRCDDSAVPISLHFMTKSHHPQTIPIDHPVYHVHNFNVHTLLQSKLLCKSLVELRKHMVHTDLVLH